MRRAAKSDVDPGVFRSVADERAQHRPIVERWLPAFDCRDEAREGEHTGGRRSITAERERVAHPAPHREATEHGALWPDPRLLPQLIVELCEQCIGGGERLRIGVADAWDDVRVVATPARQRQRCARRDDVKAPPWVERVGERQQVVLVRTATVVQHEQAARLACRWGCRTLTEYWCAHARSLLRGGAASAGCVVVEDSPSSLAQRTARRDQFCWSIQAKIARDGAITVPSASFSVGSFVPPVAARNSSREPLRRNGIGLPWAAITRSYSMPFARSASWTRRHGCTFGPPSSP